MWQKDDIKMDVLYLMPRLYVQLMYIQHHHLPIQYLFSMLLPHNNTQNFSIQLKIPEEIKFFSFKYITYKINSTFPKLPFPSTAKKWKSSMLYFLNLGTATAGGVIFPVLAYCI